MILRVLLIIILALVVVFVAIPLSLRLSGVDLFSSDTGETGFFLQSADQGATWRNIAQSEDPQLTFTARVQTLTVHPANPDTLLAGTAGAGLWRSNNQGLSWIPMFDRTGGLEVSARIYAIAIHPIESRIMYLAAFQQNRGRVFKSENGGETFREIYVTTADGASVFDVLVDRDDPARVMIATGQGGIIESKNGGISWRPQQWFKEGVVRLFANPRDSMERYALAARGNLWKTIDGGQNWIDIPESVSGGTFAGIQYPPPDAFNFFGFGGIAQSAVSLAFTIDPQNPSTLYAGDAKGLIRSTDAGFTWQTVDLLIPPQALPIRAIAVEPGNSSTIWVVAGGELHRTEDYGLNWHASRLPVQGIVSLLFIHPFKSDILFIAI